MKKNKKIIPIFLTAVLALCAGCGDTGAGQGEELTTVQSVEEITEDINQEEDTVEAVTDTQSEENASDEKASDNSGAQDEDSLQSDIELESDISAEGADDRYTSTEIEEVSEKEENHYTCSFDGIAHDFFVYAPEQIEGSPLIIMLHGYGQTAESFRIYAGLHKVAVEKGYTVVYVTGAVNPDDVTSAVGWNSGLGDSGNRDVEFLVALADYMNKEYKTDENRVYAAGFSNGAFMTHRLALEASGTFKAVVSVAGMMTESVWNTRPEKLDVGIFEIYGEKDDVVPKQSDGSAESNKNPAIEDVMDYYVTANGLSQDSEEETGKKSVLTKYIGNTDKQVWTLFIGDGRHSWPDEGVTGININELIIDYLDTIG